MTEAKNSELAKKIEDGGNATLTKDDPSYWSLAVERQLPEFSKALSGTGIDPQHFARIALTAIRKSEALQKASFPSLMGAIMATAQLGLEPHGPLGQAYFVPYKGEVQLILGYQGLIELAYRSGRVMSIVARVIHRQDDFDYEYGTNEHITHKPKLNAAGDNPITGAYAIAKLAGGGQVFVVMEVAEIEAIKARSKAGDSGPWKTDYEAMARKTAVRQLFKWLPASIEIQAALGSDTGIVRQIPASVDDFADAIDVDGTEV